MQRCEQSRRCYAGAWELHAEALQFNFAFASSEFIAGDLGCGHKEIDGCRHDIWAVAALLVYIITDKIAFVPEDGPCDGRTVKEQIRDNHLRWVQSAHLHCCFCASFALAHAVLQASWNPSQVMLSCCLFSSALDISASCPQPTCNTS